MKSKDIVTFIRIRIHNELLFFFFFLHLPLNQTLLTGAGIFFPVERKRGKYNEWIKCSSSDFLFFFLESHGFGNDRSIVCIGT